MPYADFSPRLDELAVRGELADARRRATLESLGDRGRSDHLLGVVPVRHVDAAVGPDDDVVGLVELAVRVAWLAGDTEAEKLFTLGAELVDLVPFGSSLVAREIRDPHVSLPVHVDA